MTHAPHPNDCQAARRRPAGRPPRARARATRSLALLTLLALTAAMLLVTASAQGTAATSEATFPNGIQGDVQLAPAKGFVGSQATLEGSGFTPGATLDVTWGAFDGTWKLEMQDGEYDGNFLGRAYTQRDVQLGSVTVAADGTFSAPFTVPEGFGGTHDVYVRDNGINLNKAGYFVKANWSMSPESGPVGTDITITATGLDELNNIAGWDALTYDHAITGFITAQTTRGTAKVVIPATGRAGKHFIQIQNAAFDAPYLAVKSSPYAYLNLPEFTFTVTDGAPILPAPVTEQNPSPTPGSEPGTTGAKLWVDPSAGAVNAPAQIHGRDLPADAQVKLAFTEMSGSRVTVAGYQGISVPVATVTTDAEGAFDAPFHIPDALGGAHRLEATINDHVVAKAYFTIKPTALPLQPTSGPVGTPITLHMKGIGWTQTNNIFAVVVDNVFIGYACGFSTNGDVVVPLTASWAPGWHIIDLYPSFYRNKEYSKVDEQPFLFRQAVLTWQDHPNKMHFRYAYQVTGDGTDSVAPTPTPTAQTGN